MSILPGTYSLQNASIYQPTNSVSVKVTCTFAVNAPSTGCSILFENVTLGSFSSTVPRSPTGSLLSSGVVNIPQPIVRQAIMQGLTSAVFDVKLYDLNEEGKVTGSPAVEQRHVLEVVLVNAGPTSEVSVPALGKKSSSYSVPGHCVTIMPMR